MKKLTLFLLLAFFAGVTLNAATQYCHTEISNGSKTILMTCSPTGNANEYQILFEGTEDVKITGVNNANVGINDINGAAGGVALSFNVSQAGNGSAKATFTKNGTPAAPYVAYMAFATSVGEVVFNPFPTDMDWTASCSAGPSDDTEAPVMTSASLVSETHNSAVIAVKATDNVGVTKYVVYNNAAKQGEYAPADSKITVTGLTPSTSYTLTVKAKDAAGNESAEGKDVEVTTDDDPKADNTQCKGWNDDMWASEGGYTYDFSTTATDVVLKITAIGEFPPEMAASPQILFTRRNGGDGFESGGVVSGKTITWTFSKTGVLTRDDNPYLFSDNTIHFKPYIARRSGVDQTNEIIYTVGEDCQEPGPTPELTDPKLTITDPSTAAIELAIDATKQITWTSSNTATPTFTSSKESVAIVSDAGVITAKAIGSATITIKQAETDTYQEATQTITVTVPGDKSKNTECSGWEDAISDGTKSDLGYNYKFTTEGTSVKVEIEFLADFTGMLGYMWDETSGFSEIDASVEGKKVTHTFTNKTLGDALKFCMKLAYTGGMIVTKQFTYHVGEDCQPHPVTGVSITSEFTEIEVGQSKTMTAEVKPFNATNKNVTWSITSGEDYATINSSGTLTANKEGSVTVQVETDDGGYTATKTIIIVAAKPTAPSAAPAAPTHPANKVKAVYSTTYDADCGFGYDWGSDTQYTQDTYGKKYVNGDGGYFGMVGFNHNCSQMEKLHLDVWALEAGSFRVVPIYKNPQPQLDDKGVTITISDSEAKAWKSVDIALNEGEFAQITDWSNIYQIKIDNAANTTFWLNNIYFYTTQEKTTCALSASVKNNEGGTASVDNAEVTKGGSATFTAVADCGYSFVGWWNNTTKVSEDATYTPTDIQEDLSLVAEFAFVGPSEAATVPSYDMMIPIYTNGTPAEGVSMTTSWGQRTIQNQVSVAGHTMFKYGNINYQGIAFENNLRNVSTMQYIHLDIWSTETGIIKFFLIWPGQGNETSVTVDLIGCQWNSINIPLNEFTGADLTQIHQFKLDAQTSTVGEGAIDGATILVQDIFFYGFPQITLSEKEDNAATLTENNGKVCDVTIGRTFIADGANYTLCLPFSMTADQCLAAFGEGYKLFLLGAPYMKTTDVMYLPFSEVTAIEAGKPYLFCPAANVENPTIEGVTIDAEAPITIGNEYAKMAGIYSPTIVAASNYVLGEDNWLYQSDGTQMYGLRCYFTFGSGVSQNVRARAVFHNTDVVTDLEPIDNAQSMPNGKYIIDGRFVIIRNNVRYNGIGQQVK